MLPYEQYLKRFPAYLQQLTMESNGKRVTQDGSAVGCDTGPVYWGEPGTNGQHSFYQLIHQGTRLIPCDFIAFANSLNPARAAARHADRERLRAGGGARLRQDGRGGASGGHARGLVAHRVFEGNRPSSTRSSSTGSRPRRSASWSRSTSTASITQGAIWGIDPFDQWGVELGKVLAQRIIPELDATDDAGARPRQLDQRADPPLPASGRDGTRVAVRHECREPDTFRASSGRRDAAILDLDLTVTVTRSNACNSE